MTTSIALIVPGQAVAECDFITGARAAYDIADGLVDVLDRHRKASLATRRRNMNALRYQIQLIENSLWEALSRDYPKFRFRRQDQTIVVSYNTSGTQTVYINPGEVYKIKSWGVNDYYEALDTINRIQSKMFNDSNILNRRWKDDWKRLGNQLVTIDRRHCKGFNESRPGVVILPPPCIPMPPNPPGPELPDYPCPAIPSLGSWSTLDVRNWSIMGWTNSLIAPMLGGLGATGPSITMIAGRELVYYKTPGTNPTKLIWLFHDNNGTARSWFTSYEKLKYIKKFIDAGYAVAAYDSFNRISKRWTLTTVPHTNREVADLLACQKYLAQVGILRRVCTSVVSVNPQTGYETVTQSCNYVGVSQFAVGAGMGGNMATYVAGSLGITKVIVHNAIGATPIVRNASYSAKTMWMLSSNDITISNADAVANYNYLLANNPSLNAQLYTQPGNVLAAASLDAIPNVTTPVSTSIVAALVTSGFINSNGTMTTKYSSANNATRETYLQQTIPALIATVFGADAENYRKYVGDIIEQIRIAFSDNEFSGIQREDDSGLLETERDLTFLAA